ncbi:hypothetical protein [Desulfovibrio sp. UCD-KL4C]|uniref:hypothetical protein n=1 Tax=Desulfovibrio sp. UCD-KL4C TaxID=2578120 RepID=UPI0025BBF4ED|nr:hypothetical protein [Desulfovibrio sp. UCD-KL4C]
MDAYDTDVVRDFEKAFSGRKTVLVTLQGFSDLLSDSIVFAMRNAPQDWCWLLRLPPAHSHRKAELVSELKVNRISNYDLDISNRASLYTLLKRVDQHVTYFSSVCYEALAFGINSIVTHASSRELYLEYINKGYFIYAATGRDLLSSLRENMVEEFIVEETPYMVKDIKNARKIVGSFLSRSFLGNHPSVR